MAPADSDGRAPKRAKLNFRDKLTILVGNEKVEFVAHEDILCKRSPFFKAACSETWKDNAVGKVELPTDTPATFELYLQILYTDNVFVQTQEEKNTTPGSSGQTFERLADTYILADKLGDLFACNAVIDEFIRHSDEISNIPRVMLIRRVTESSRESSPLLRLFIGYYINEVTLAGLRESGKGIALGTEFLLAVVIEHVKRLKAKQTTSVKASARPKCHYHQHNDDYAEY